MIPEKTIYKIVLSTPVSVRFADVDAYNIVHNVNYFHYFDIGRFAMVDRFLRKEKPSEVGNHLFLILKTNCKYLRYAQAGDQLTVETVYSYNIEQNSAKIEFFHRIFKEEGKTLIAEGSTTLGICDHNYKLFFKIPEEVKNYLRERLSYHLENPSPEVKIL